jgi:hypothetical protein
MKKFPFTLTIPFAFLVFIFSCTRNAEVKFPPHHAELVVHGYTEVGEYFHVSLGKTLGMNERVNDSATYVKNGWVLICENNIFADSLQYDSLSQQYVSANLVAASGKTYKLVAGAPGFQTVEALTVAPAPVSYSVTRINNARTTSTGIVLDDIRFTVNDPAPQPNYYITSLYSSSTFSLCAYTYDPVIEKYTGSLTPFNANDCINSEQILFNDVSFNGASKEITISAAHDNLEKFVNPATGSVYKSYIKWYNVPYEHYRYFKDALLLDANNLPSFTNPVSIKGNVKNGYGIFSVYTAVTDSLP